MAVCIAGMHRSGTSMIARMLNICGLYLGKETDLIQGTNDNPEGYWEHAKLSEINNQILNRLGGGWDIVPQIEPGWASQNILDDLKINALQEIQMLSEKQPWGWKDPRNSITFEFWEELIPDLKYIICVRDPYEVYRSLVKRGYASPRFAYGLWLEYYKHLLAHFSPNQYIVTHYDTFFHDPANELRRITAFVNIGTTEQQIQTASNTVSRSLKHNTANFPDTETSEPPKDVMAIYSKLCAQAGPVYRSLDAESFVLAQPHDESFEYRRKTSSLKKEIREKEIILQQTENTLRQTENSLQQTENTLQQTENT
jgi:hypothetical protein